MVIVGAGGLGREILTILIEDNFQDDIVFYDENPQIEPLLYHRYPVLQNLSALKELFNNGDKRFVTAIGSPRLREKLTNKIENKGGILCSVISKRTTIFHFNPSYQGAIIQPGVGISYGVEIGTGSAIHINATIGHCVQMGRYINIGPNASVIGPCTIGDYSYISAQTCVLPNVSIGKHVIVNAGMVVDRDLADYEIF
ncbi:MAG: acetyltransferase [Bacteroidota bacterium]